MTVVDNSLVSRFVKPKYPIIRQYDQIDCGPAALLSVLKYYGGNICTRALPGGCQRDHNA